MTRDPPPLLETVTPFPNRRCPFFDRSQHKFGPSWRSSGQLRPKFGPRSAGYSSELARVARARTMSTNLDPSQPKVAKYDIQTCSTPTQIWSKPPLELVEPNPKLNDAGRKAIGQNTTLEQLGLSLVETCDGLVKTHPKYLKLGRCSVESASSVAEPNQQLVQLALDGVGCATYACGRMPLRLKGAKHQHKGLFFCEIGQGCAGDSPKLPSFWARL